MLDVRGLEYRLTLVGLVDAVFLRRALSMRYFSVTVMVARGCPVSGSMSTTSLPSSMPSAVALSTDKVMGMGQNKPSLMRMSSHTPRQSS
jgi:hypothetical protein